MPPFLARHLYRVFVGCWLLVVVASHMPGVQKYVFCCYLALVCPLIFRFLSAGFRSNVSSPKHYRQLLDSYLVHGNVATNLDSSHRWCEIVEIPALQTDLDVEIFALCYFSCIASPLKSISNLLCYLYPMFFLTLHSVFCADKDANLLDQALQISALRPPPVASPEFCFGTLPSTCSCALYSKRR